MSKEPITASPLSLAPSEGFTYWVTVDQMDTPPDHHNLRITSQWYGAKNPDEQQLKVALFLHTMDLEALYQWLGRYLSRIRNR